MIARVALVILAAFLLGAHFLRQGLVGPAIVCVAMPLLFLVRRPWSRIVLQAFTYSGSALWAFTAAGLAQERIGDGLPWMRGTTILVFVSLATFAAGWLLNSKVIKSHF